MFLKDANWFWKEDWGAYNDLSIQCQAIFKDLKESYLWYYEETNSETVV